MCSVNHLARTVRACEARRVSALRASLSTRQRNSALDCLCSLNLRPKAIGQTPTHLCLFRWSAPGQRSGPITHSAFVRFPFDKAIVHRLIQCDATATES